MNIIRGCFAAALTAGFAGLLATAGCGSDACETVCGDTYDREVACHFFLDAGDRDTAVNSCKQSLESNGASDDQCDSAQSQIDSATCADLAASACPNVPSSNQGSGCKSAS